MTAAAEAVNTFANLAIVLGYLLVPFTWLPYLPLPWNVRIAGATFFTTCAMTHLAMAFGLEHDRWMVVNHVVQAIAVFWFVFGFWTLLRGGYLEAATRRDPPAP